MALKAKITKEEFAKLNEAFKSEYIEDGDGYKLDVDGAEDTGALKRAKDRETQLRKDAEKKAQELQEQLDATGADDARKRGDVATLEKSWQTKMDTQKAEYEGRIGKLTAHTTKSLVENVAQSIASKISTAPGLLLPHIRSRLQADFEGDEPKTRILDKDGKPSALTVAELEAEFVANKEFAPIIRASSASGGAGKPANSGGGATQKTGNGNQPDSPNLSAMNPKALADHIAQQKADQAQ